MLEDTWPLDLITSNERQPLEVFTPTAFAAQVLLADHLEDVVVFRNGEQALGIAREDCLPEWVSDCLEHAKDAKGASVLKFLRRAVSTLKASCSRPTWSSPPHRASRRRRRCPRSVAVAVAVSLRSPGDRAQVTTSRSRS